MESGPPIVVVMVKDDRYVKIMDFLARDIATSLTKCSHLRLEDILDNKDMSDPESIRLGLDKACRIAITQLRSGQSVIINCLTSFSQFSMLKPLYDSPHSYNGDAFVILHCYASFPTQKEPLSYVDSRVPRLLVNTYLAVDCDEVIQILKDIAYCSRGHVVNLYEWKPFHRFNECDGKKLFAISDIVIYGGHPYKNATHAITEFKQVQHGAHCGACLKEVSGEAYTCRCGCNVVMHKECLPMEAHSKTPNSLIQLLQLRLLGGYLLPEPRRCKQCKVAQREFSDGCQRCVIQSLIKSGLTPPVKATYEYVLQAIRIPQSNPYICAACGKQGSYAGYSCFRCDKHYHVGCVFMPLSLTCQHGGWEHKMDLQFKSSEDEEGTFCDFCCKDLDPNFWFYSCREGCYLTHVECVFSQHYDQEYMNDACTPEDDAICKEDKHIITFLSEHEVKGKHVKYYCVVCEKQISDDMYACEGCSFSLHKSCAETSEKPLTTPNERWLAFLRSPVGYPFVKSHLCPFCEDEPNLLPYECGHCIFQANLRQKEWPPLLHHRGHHDEHQLSFWAMPLPRLGHFFCYGCDKPGTLISYDDLDERYKCFHISCGLSSYELTIDMD